MYRINGILTKGKGQIIVEMTIFQPMILEQLEIYIPKAKQKLGFLNSEWVIYLKIKSKNVKFLENNIGEKSL